jgi:excisionase family DNA binding protein
MPDTTLTTSQVARRLGLSAERVRQLTRAGRLPAHRTALGCLYDRDDVDQFASARRRRGPDDPGTVKKRPEVAAAVEAAAATDPDREAVSAEMSGPVISDRATVSRCSPSCSKPASAFHLPTSST